MYLLKRVMFIFASCLSVGYADNVSDAIAISAGQTAVAVTSGVVMKNMGVEPQYISTPTGIVAVPANNNTNQGSTISQADQYQQQNDQAGKQAFFDGAF
ncbi:hypothetical protein L3V83_05055 [Thiotrichales bacterium 19X7-9]|nr:hypothetical protein [Thiotrichales bacterium 19X7-9]